MTVEAMTVEAMTVKAAPVTAVPVSQAFGGLVLLRSHRSRSQPRLEA